MRLVRYGVLAVLAVGLLFTSVGWYLAAHPGGTRFESCHWQGDQLVLGYTYGTGDTVTTVVKPHQRRRRRPAARRRGWGRPRDRRAQR